jgi:hypothetical protein
MEVFCVEPRTPPQTLAALEAAVRDPKGSVAVAPAQITELLQYKPRDVTEYLLARIARGLASNPNPELTRAEWRTGRVFP